MKIKFMVLAFLGTFMLICSPIHATDAPYWTERSSFVDDEYLYTVGIASNMEKEEDGREQAFHNGVREIKNYLLTDEIKDVQVETQMTFTEHLPNGHVTVYRLLKIRFDEIHKYLTRKKSSEKIVVDKLWAVLDSTLHSGTGFSVDYDAKTHQATLKFTPTTKRIHTDNTEMLRTYLDVFVALGTNVFKIDDVDSLRFIQWANFIDSNGTVDTDAVASITVSKTNFTSVDWDELNGKSPVNKVMAISSEYDVNRKILPMIKSDELYLTIL